jgi:hypothetical protein
MAALYASPLVIAKGTTGDQLRHFETSLFRVSDVNWAPLKDTENPMNTLKKFAAPLVLAAAGLALAMPVQAAPYGRHDNHVQAWQLTPARSAQIRQDINSLNNAIDRAAARRTISQREARGLRNQARDIQRLYAHYSRGGLTRAEVGNLQSRVNNVRVALRMERRDWDGRRG